MTKTQYHRLPDGKQTKSVKRYIDQWHAITQPLNRMFEPFGLRVSGFDPGVLLIGEHRASVNLDRDVAEFLAKVQVERES